MGYSVISQKSYIIMLGLGKRFAKYETKVLGGQESFITVAISYHGSIFFRNLDELLISITKDIIKKITKIYHRVEKYFRKLLRPLK